MGVAYQIAGYPKDKIIGQALPSDVDDTPNESKGLLGMKLRYSMNDLSEFNDGSSNYEHHTFKEIAKVLLGEMKPKRKL